MEFYDVIKARRSVRKYKDTPVDHAVINRILETALLAPSWCNHQSPRYVLVNNCETKKELGLLINNPNPECYEKAPYALVLMADPSDSGSLAGKEYYLVDCGISMEHIVLAAAAEGLGTCWVGYFRESPVRNLLNISDDMRIVAVTPIGYPDDEPKPRERMKLSEIVMENGYGTR